MKIKKKFINNFLLFFLFTHLVIWTLIPSISNTNLPLDTIEALAWSNELKMGYDKFPPILPLFLELFYQIFGNQDWAYYFLSQIIVLSSFFIVFHFSKFFFTNPSYGLISILLLEGIYFHNFTTPELNPLICQLPFVAATVFYGWKSIKFNDNTSWTLFGVFSALAVLTFYLSFYLLFSLSLFFVFIIVSEKKFNFKYLIALISFFIVFSPHLFWVIDNNYITVNYGLFRSIEDPLSGISSERFLDHTFYPLIFLLKQIGILIPFFVMFFFIIKKNKFKINYKDKKLLFLASITILPIILMFLTSLFGGIRIRTMWMTSFYLFIGVFFIYIFKEQIDLKKYKSFFVTFLFLFLISPVFYFFTSYLEKDKRTDYPGKKISSIVQSQWDNNFSNEIEKVVGDGWVNGGWYAGNLSYHLDSRPKLRDQPTSELDVGTVIIKGINEINNCEGFFFQIEPFNDLCLLGKK
jgi:hypothetical protein